MSDRGTTHSVNCWSWGPKHYECALAKIGRHEAAAIEALAFIDRVEGHGYGGEADHMVAQIMLREAVMVPSTETPEQRSERILLSTLPADPEGSA